MPQKRGPESATLPVVGDRDGELGLIRPVPRAHVTGNSDPVTCGGVNRDKGLVIVVVDVREVRELLWRELRGRAEKAPVA